jgi:hypothetical protein
VPELSDRDRQRLERGRQSAAVKLARERARIEKGQAREAAWRDQEAQRRLRLGPLEVVGPDGGVVSLAVVPSGGGGPSFSRHGGASAVPTELIEIPIWLAVALAGAIGHWVAFRGGSTVHVSAAGRKRIKIRMRSETAAAARLKEIAEAVEREGLAALDQWSRR